MTATFDFRGTCLVVTTDDTAVTVIPLRNIVAIGADYENLWLSIAVSGESMDFQAANEPELSSVVEWFIMEQRK